MDVPEWEAHLERLRRRKDRFFAAAPESPLPLEDRGAFRGLLYWPPDPEYRYELDLHEPDTEQIVELADTGGQTRRMWHRGEFRFRVAGRRCTLHAYKSDPDEDRLFIPFRDETAGRETYSAGRYLDLELDSHLTEEGQWILDFNEAYNPWCAYSERYVCPFVPQENWLPVPIRAGEKNCPLKSR